MNNPQHQLIQESFTRPQAIDLAAFRHIHFVGIGGVSMSALAEIMRMRGTLVTGSDLNESGATRSLRQNGIEVKLGHAAAHIEGADLVVYTAAVPQDNPELLAARAAGVRVEERARFLGAILNLYGCPIGVSGTHGKTTTTSMISQILLQGGYDPTVLVGGTLPLIGQNFKVGASPYIVYEACEYVDSFLHFSSYVTVVLNIDNDHLDYFTGLEHIKASFAKYAGQTLPGGCVVANGDDAAVRSALEQHRGEVLWFSIEDPGAAVYGLPVAQDTSSTSPLPQAFEVYERGALLGRCTLAVPGRHNMMNALAAIAVCRFLEVPFEAIAAGLGSFEGAQRRFEKKGIWKGVQVVDDYAHHPSEIRATLQAAAAQGFNRVVCVFQPHTYSRTKMLFEDFVSALSLADLPVLVDIYAAREAFDPGVSAQQLALRIPGARYAPARADALQLLRQELREGDLLLTMGAGDIFKLGEELLAEI